MSAAAVVLPMPVRRAQARDVKHAGLGRWAVQVYRDLVLHVNAENICWPKIRTQAEDLQVSERTVTNARNELLENGWICYPQGDSGGRDVSKPGWSEPRGKGIRIHLHPDGCPCGLPKVQLKQRDASAAANEKRAQKRAARELVKDEIRSSLSDPVKDENQAVKDEIQNCAYKERTFSTETLSTATASERKTEPVVAAPSPKSQKAEAEQPATKLEKQLRSPETVKAFAELQTLLQNQLQPVGKIRILQAAERHDFTLPLLHWAFKHHASGLNLAGGLVKFAAEWPTYTAGLPLPDCLQCFGDGTIACPESPYDGLAPCTCVAGEKQAQGAFKHYKAWLTDRSFCVHCGNTGDGEYGDNCFCAAGRQRGEQWAAEKARRVEMEALGICTWCEGSGTISCDAGKPEKPCFCCSGTGKTVPPMDRAAKRKPSTFQYFDTQ